MTLRRRVDLEHVHDLEDVPMHEVVEDGVGDTRYFKDVDKGLGWIRRTWACPRCDVRVVVREMMQDEPPR